MDAYLWSQGVSIPSSREAPPVWETPCGGPGAAGTQVVGSEWVQEETVRLNRVGVGEERKVKKQRCPLETGKMCL